MLKKLGELQIKKSDDYYENVTKALEKAGIILVLDVETSTDRYYIVAQEEEE